MFLNHLFFRSGSNTEQQTSLQRITTHPHNTAKIRVRPQNTSIYFINPLKLNTFAEYYAVCEHNKMNAHKKYEKSLLYFLL